VLTGYVLPQLNVADYACLAVGPSIVVLTVAIARAMAKHRLFDVRAFFARSLGYLVLVFVLSVLYGSVLFAVTKVIFNRFTIDENSKLIISTLLAVVLALTFQSLRTFVDGLTRRLFYRDSYDTQTVLDAVSGVIVGNVDPHKVQKGALTILSDALKPTFARFILLNSSGNFTEADGWGQKWDMHDPEALQGVLKRLGNKITIYDDIVDQSKKSKEVLKTEGINLVAPLVTKDENIGYLVIGSKKSGDIYSQKDTGLLNIATNELAVALQNAQRFEEIQAFNITLQEKITDATRELKRSNKKLIALDEAKDEFISMASHQLRTPLTSVKGYISMMLEEDLGKVNAAQEKALKEAFGSSQRMVYLIADFLNVSRIKTGKFMIEPKEVDLPEIVREELTQLREMASSRELTLEYDQPEVFPRVKLDDNKIRQVMMNMVDNAIYYTPTGGTIVIQLYSTGSEIYFKVVDSGIGVPKAEQHKLFTKFYRAGNARKARPDGTGLGLFMAQKIVAEQGGAIIFESEEGKGSTFGFRFPLDKIKI
jgi:signal transduction histidine kinase